MHPSADEVDCVCVEMKSCRVEFVSLFSVVQRFHWKEKVVCKADAGGWLPQRLTPKADSWATERFMRGFRQGRDPMEDAVWPEEANEGANIEVSPSVPVHPTVYQAGAKSLQPSQPSPQESRVSHSEPSRTGGWYPAGGVQRAWQGGSSSSGTYRPAYERSAWW